MKGFQAVFVKFNVFIQKCQNSRFSRLAGSPDSTILFQVEVILSMMTLELDTKLN